MTQATQTTLGEIKLAGDLAGTAEAPSLSSTGVTAGTYVFPTIAVNSKGRITSATSGSSEDIRALIPGATKTKKGIVQVGDNIEVTTTTTQGYTLIDFGGTIVGTADSGLEYDPCRPYTFKLNYTDGTSTSNKTISYSPGAGGVTFTGLISALNTLIGYSAVSIVAGNIRFVPNATGAGSFINLIDDCLFKYLTGYVGNISTDFGMDSSTIWVKEASVSDYGVIKAGSGLNVANGVLTFDSNQIPKATPSTLGVVKVGSGLSVNSGVVSANPASFNLPIATDTTLGVVSVGDGIAVAGDGKISVTLPDASTTTKGVVQVGSGLSVSSGTVSVPSATYSTPGILSASASHFVLNEGELSVNLSALGATETNPGLVKIGTGLVASGGVISVDTSSLPAASKSAKGAVQVGANIDVVDGVISVPVASTTTKGVVKIDTSKGFVINPTTGQLSMTNATILASTTNTGLVRIGSGIAVNNGVISVSIPDATTSSKGKVQIGSGINVTSGTISIPVATGSVAGTVKIGAGLAVTDGVLSSNIQDASYSTKGLVKIGSTLNVSGGTVSVPIATNSVQGTVKIGTGLSVSGDGTITPDYANFIKASSTTAGVAKIGEGLEATNGVISVKLATPTTPGIVMPGEGVSVTNGVINCVAGDATTQTKGIVSIGDNLTVSNGVVSAVINNATASVKGIMKVGTGLTDDGNGTVSLDTTLIPELDKSNLWNGAQLITPKDNSNVGSNIDLTTSNVQTFYWAGSYGGLVIANPIATSATINGSTQTITGKFTYILTILPYASSNSYFQIGWGNKYKFANGTPPTITYHATLTKRYAFDVIVLDANTILVDHINTWTY